MKRYVCVLYMVLLSFSSLPAFAQAPAAPKVDSGDTAWMLASAALVLFMTIPGLALFYGGLVRSKNVLGTLMQSFIMVGLITLQWIVIGYSLAFATGTSFLGNLNWMGLSGVVDAECRLRRNDSAPDLHDLPVDVRHYHARTDDRGVC